MVIPNTYQNKFGVYYFRLTKRISAHATRLHVRFSLRTRNPKVAKTRANVAWLHAQIYFNEQGGNTAHLTAVHMRQYLQSMLFADADSTYAEHLPSVAQLCSNNCGVVSSLEYRNAVGQGGAGIPANELDGLIKNELRVFADRKFADECWSPRTKLHNDTVFETFVDVVGNKQVSKITRADVDRFIEVVDYLPPNRKKKAEFRMLSAADAAAKNRSIGGPRLSLRQRKYYCSVLSPVFNIFVEEGLIPFNFFHRYRGRAKSDGPAHDARHPFTPQELKVMFESDQGIALLASDYQKPSRAWGYLLALFTGARAGEIYSLPISNIFVSQGVPCIRFDGSVCRLKTAAAYREIPIHPTLLELGFMDFVDRSHAVQTRRKQPMLFPELNLNAAHGPSRAPTHWFNTSFLPRLKIKTKKKVFHGFRHTLCDQIKRGRKLIDSGAASRYVGHTDTSGPMWSHLYGSPYSATELIEVTEIIKYDLNLQRLKIECLNQLRPIPNAAK